MTAAVCGVCRETFADIKPEDPIQTVLVIAPGDPIPPGAHHLHICPQMAPADQAPAQTPRTGDLGWDDAQRRAAIAAAMPSWEIRDDDHIFCTSWFEPGLGRGHVDSAPLTIQVRRAGVDLKYAEQGVDFAEASFGRAEAKAFVEQLGIEPWDDLLIEDEPAGEDG